MYRHVQSVLFISNYMLKRKGSKNYQRDLADQLPELASFMCRITVSLYIRPPIFP